MRSSFSGFTLIEVLLSTTILGVMAGCISVFILFSLQNRIRSQVVTEVDQQGIQVAQMISQSIRNAETISTPLPAASAGSLVLTLQPSTNSPTVFSLASGAVRSAEGVNPSQALTTGQVVASNLLFRNLSRSGTPGIIQYQFTLTFAASSTRAEYVYAKSFSGSAALRQP